jgi:hypothetical protein
MSYENSIRGIHNKAGREYIFKLTLGMKVYKGV